MKREWVWSLILAAALALSACDNGASAVAEADGDAPPAQTAPAARASSGPAQATADVPQIDGKPMWSSTRTYTAEENAARAFATNGADFGAADVDAFVKLAHDFTSKPPRGTLTQTRASNGDTLFYDPAANIFAVATRDGAPRTMFKPDEGRAYWDKQVATEKAAAAG